MARPPQCPPARGSVVGLAAIAVALLSLTAGAHAQLLGDEAPYFLWADRWVGTVSGSEVLQREMRAQGAYLKMASTSTAEAQVTFNQVEIAGAVVHWWGSANRAHATYRSGVFLNAGASSQVVDSTEGDGEVVLDDDLRFNGLSIDVANRTYTVALNSCTRARCDSITTTRNVGISTPGFARAFGDTKNEQQGVGIVAEVPLPEPGQGLQGAYAPPSAMVAGSKRTLHLDHELAPAHELAAWAAAYRAGYLEARQGQLDTFRDYAAAHCTGGSSLFEPDPTCRAAKRARDQLTENADVATKDFSRVTSALIEVTCPGFTRNLNSYLQRSRDVVLDGPLATYEAVREVLVGAVVEDLKVSYDRLPDFMRCLYDYDTYGAVVTLRLPGTSPTD